MEKHRPERGSDVEAYLKTRRDDYIENTLAWFALDDLLDDYRLRADCGYTLSRSLDSEGETMCTCPPGGYDPRCPTCGKTED